MDRQSGSYLLDFYIMPNVFLKKDYTTNLTITLPNTSTWEIWITLNDSTDSDMGYLLLEPGTIREESIFYHRRVGNTVYCYGVNRDNPVEHLATAVVYMANSIDYMNYIIGQSYEQTFIYKKSLSDVIITGGSFYISGESVTVAEVDTSLWISNKKLFVGVTNYVYINEGEYYITTAENTALFLVATIVTSLGWIINSITKHNTVSIGTGGWSWGGGGTTIISDGIQWKWAYVWSTNYVINDAVSYNGSTYVCIAPTLGNIPTNVIYWDLMAKKGSDGGWAWDMIAATYDPNGIEGDVFSMWNMVETATKKILTDVERAKIATINTGQWVEVTGTSQTAVVNAWYIANNASQVIITLPDTAALWSVIEVVGKGAGGWKIAQPASTAIHFVDLFTSTGTSWFISSNSQYDSIKLVCVIANTKWEVISSTGNLTIF